MKTIELLDNKYELIKNDRDCFNLEEVKEKATDYFTDYDYIFGDYAYPNSFFVDSEGNFLVRYVGDGGARCKIGLEAALEAAEG